MSEPINPEEPIKKKRGRKKKSELATENITSSVEEKEPAVAKKRGRKPKGGKLYIKENDNNIEQNSTSNVILHLKCCLKDVEDMDIERNAIVTDPLEYNPQVPPDIQTYDNVDNANYFQLEEQPITSNVAYVKPQTVGLCSACKTTEVTDNINSLDDNEEVDMKDVASKLKEMKIKLYRSNNIDKKAACFWCTYDFDNQSCHIPKYEMDEEIHGYGSFCRPECAAAYLMKENIDDSTKFERYHLLNQIYSKVYDYKKNIRPAPDPHYLLDKFYGNLTIKEYRKMLKSEHMMLIIEKPMTRILPELHEDNEDIGNSSFVGQSTGNAGVYKVKRQSEKQKGPSKNEIIRENFGI